jgi:hypothetical protein
MWEEARGRKGAWVLSVPYRRHWFTHYVSYRDVVYTFEEWDSLSRVVTNGLYGFTKKKTYDQLIYQRAADIWKKPTYTSEVMRTVGPWAMSEYKCQRSLVSIASWRELFCASLPGAAASCFVWLVNRYGPDFIRNRTSSRRGILLQCGLVSGALFMSYNQLRVARPRVRKYTDWEPRVTPDTSFDEAESGSTNVEQPDQPGLNQLGFPRPGEDSLEHPCGACDETDASIRCTQHETNTRFVEMDAGQGVVGQSAEGTTAKRIVGAATLPTSCPPNVYIQEVRNAEIAIEERMTKKKKSFTGTVEDIEKINSFVAEAMGNNKTRGLFSVKKVSDLLWQKTMELMKSKKWATSRFENAFDQLLLECDPQYKLKAQVKMEPMPEGKAPRLLIADGDRGQLMALLVIGLIEELIKKHFPEKGIKGRAKRDAVANVASHMSVPHKMSERGFTVFEGDGSAWDTTCSLEVRELVENPIIEHVTNIVQAFGEQIPNTWSQSHLEVCRKKKLRLLYDKNKQRKCIDIPAIRRSGHRGTSCLNWWVNYTLWHCSLFSDPKPFLCPENKWGTDVTGKRRWMVSAFEGDDSIIMSSPKLEDGDELHTLVLQHWDRMGFNMKIELRDKRALFVGYYIGLGEKGANGTIMPEIDRCLGRAGITCSPAFLDALDKGDKAKCQKLSGAAALSRAFEFAGLCPTLSNKFLEYSDSVGVTVTHDLLMRVSPEDEDVDVTSLRDSIILSNAGVEDELANLERVGFPITLEEKAKFVDYKWDYDRLHCWEEFRDSLPSSWR